MIHNFQKYRLWLEDDLEGVKKLDEQFDKNNKEFLENSNSRVRAHFFPKPKNQLGRRAKMQKYLGTVIRRITCILKS